MVSSLREVRFRKDMGIIASRPSTPWIFLPSILFSRFLRLLCLRCILVTAVIGFAFEVYRRDARGIGFLSLTILHHILSVVGPYRFPLLYGWMDILLLLAEISCNSWLLSSMISIDKRLGYTLEKRTLVFECSIGFLITMLLILFGIKVAQLIDAKGQSLLQRVDILRNHANIPQVDDALGELQAPKGWRYPVRVLFGSNLWERKFPGEPLWIMLCRGLSCLAVVLSIIAFGLFAIFLEPVNETGVLPSREFRVPDLPEGLRTSSPITWGVVLVWQAHPNAPRCLKDAVSLTPLWPSPRVHSDTVDDPTCSRVPATSEIPASYDVVVFACARREYTDTTDVRAFRKYEYYTLPDLKLLVNFTALWSPTKREDDGVVVRESLDVYLALTNNTNDVLVSTSPSRLLPGTNIVSFADLILRQRLKNAPLVTLGVLDIYNTFLIARMATTNPDPLASTSPDYPTGPNISTLRIVSQTVYPEYDWTIVQDYRTKSVLGGFAQVGGLGSFLSVVFLILFGNSLLGILHRTRPLTPFGIVHYLDTPREKIFRAAEEEYSALRSELESLKDRPGLLKFVLDSLIDLDIIAEEPPTRKARDDIEEQVAEPPASPRVEELPNVIREERRLSNRVRG